eukprot:gene2017-2200_t
MKRGKKSGKDIDQAAIEKLALELLDPEDPDVISMEGIATLCEKLGIDPASDVRSLVLVWRLGAVSKPGQIQKSEFVEGMKQLGLSDVQGLQNYLPALDPGFLDRSEFREFYRFVFQFSREGTHKTIEKDVIVQLLPLVLDEQRAPHLSLFLSFLSSCSHTRITLDQWDSFLLFNHNVHVNLDNWEEGGAWPLLLDEYVEWRHKQDSK